MIRRLMLLVVCAAGLTGCKAAPDIDEAPPTLSVDDLAATPPAGLSMKKLDTEDKTALDFLDPPGVEAGVTDAAHGITNEGVTYTYYDYATEAEAQSAMDLWRAGQLGEAVFGFLATVEPMPALGPEGLLLQNKGTVTLVNRVGPRIVQATSQNAGDAGTAMGYLTISIGGTIETAAP